MKFKGGLFLRGSGTALFWPYDISIVFKRPFLSLYFMLSVVIIYHISHITYHIYDLYYKGGLFLRGLAQRCPHPPIKNLVSIGGPQQVLSYPFYIPFQFLSSPFSSFIFFFLLVDRSRFYPNYFLIPFFYILSSFGGPYSRFYLFFSSIFLL